jgi:hypothetical protein
VLESFTIDVFAGRVDERFRLLTDTETLDVTLVECEPLGGTAMSRVPFSLVFLGPPEPVLPQRIYPLGHDELGDFELFLVPIAQDDEGTRYQAVFT